MSKYCGFAYARHSLDYLRTLPKKARRQIVRSITRLAHEPYPPNAAIVLGMMELEEQVFRVYSGDYRILYVVRTEIVVVLDIDHRKDVYR